MNTYTLLALVALCGVALAKYEAPCCSVEDRKEVQRLWNLVWTESRTRRLVIAEATLTDLIANHPDVADYLRGKGVAAGSPEAKAFLLRLFNQIDVAVNLIDEPATLRAYLTAIKKLQYSDAKSGFFKAFDDSFMRVVGKAADCYDVDVFNRCFGRMIDLLESN